MHRATAVLRRCRLATAPPGLRNALPRSAQAALAAAPRGWPDAEARNRCCGFAADAAAAAQQQPAAVQPHSGPLSAYTAGVESGKYRADAQQASSPSATRLSQLPLALTRVSPTHRQLAAIEKLQRVWDDLHVAGGDTAETPTSGLTLVDAVAGGSSWSLWRLIAKSMEGQLAEVPPVRGLYLYGGVGTGKTMLMDVFYDTLPSGTRRSRIHFLDFMLDVHRRLRVLKSVADPLASVAQDITRSNKPGGGRMVLCLDEFMVTDVADAMILKRLFQHLFDHGLVLVSTSNRAPDKLYEGGLQRALFLPFIALLKERCEVHDIQGSQDYRRLARKLSQSLFFTGPDAFAELQCCMALFAPGLTPAPAEVEVMMGRTLRVPRAAGRVAYFTFAELCEQPVAAADFIALCTKYHTVLLDGVPRLSAATRAAAYRLVSLVDVVYEQRTRLICAAEAPPAALFECLVTQAEFQEAKARLPAAAVDELCVDDNVGFAKERTVSRLIEMQSIPYAREHATRHAPELLPSLPAEDGSVV